MTLGTAVHTVLIKKYASFEGRASRSEYWYFFLACFLAGFGVGFVGGLAGLSLDVINQISLVVQLVVLIPSIAAGVRRIHDSNRSGWFLLVPLYNLYLLIIKGTNGPNRFGTDPLAEPVV